MFHTFKNRKQEWLLNNYFRKWEELFIKCSNFSNFAWNCFTNLMRFENLTEVLISHFWRFLDIQNIANNDTAQKMKFSIKDLFSKCDQIRRKLRIWSHLLKKSLIENFIFCMVPETTEEIWIISWRKGNSLQSTN